MPFVNYGVLVKASRTNIVNYEVLVKASRRLHEGFTKASRRLLVKLRGASIVDYEVLVKRC